MKRFRKWAQQLQGKWGVERSFVKQNTGSAIVSQSACRTQLQMPHWEADAKRTLSRRLSLRMQDAEKLESIAKEVEEKLQAAGADMSGSEGEASSPSRTSDQARGLAIAPSHLEG
ncbi:UNVERIFIED_CONTAM: KRUF family protein [Hammondia hammondi]|eukprot:XP_008888330.1 KRUF family protein [Hammondia hammondi]